MKKTVCIALAIMALVLGGSLSGYAAHGGHGGGGFGGGGHVSGGHGGGWHGGGWHGGGWHGGGWYGWWGPWWWGYPYYPYYPYYPNYAPLADDQQQPEVYVQPESQQQEPSYWYFCRNPEGYYPYVKKCPNGWLRVVPSQPPGDEEE